MTAATASHRPATDPDMSRRAVALGGAGGLLFAATIVAAAIVEGAAGVAADASADEIADLVTADRWVTHSSAVLYVLGAIGIFPYLATMWDRYRERDGLAVRAGVLAFAVLGALFGSQLAVLVALTATAERLAGSPEILEGFWALSNALFAFNQCFLAVVLAGLAHAATSDRLVPRWFRPAGLIGAALLLVVPLGAVRSTDTGDLIAIGGLGFLIWIVFLVTSGTALIRSHNDSAT